MDCNNSLSDISISTDQPTPLNILPRPYSGKPIGVGVEGLDKQRLNLAKAPEHDANIIYANELPAPPRSQLTVPFPRQGRRLAWPTRKYKRDRCYAGFAKDQNMAAFVCGSGGEENGDIYRGDEFGLRYDRNMLYRGLKRDMNIVDASSKPINEIDRPKVVDSQSLFYPYPSFDNRYFPLYKVYPDTTEYTRDGIPLYNSDKKVLKNNDLIQNVRENFDIKPNCENNYTMKNEIIISTLIFISVAMILIKFK